MAPGRCRISPISSSSLVASNPLGLERRRGRSSTASSRGAVVGGARQRYVRSAQAAPSVGGFPNPSPPMLLFFLGLEPTMR